MRRAKNALTIAALIACTSQVTLAVQREQKIVARVDTATVALRHGSLYIRAVGMGRTPSGFGRAGRLLPRGARVLNKDGLLEYELVFNGVPNYSGFTLKPVSAKLKEHPVPQGVKGARIFGELNQMDALIAEPSKKKSKKAQDERAQETSESITGGSPHP